MFPPPEPIQSGRNRFGVAVAFVITMLFGVFAVNGALRIGLWIGGFEEAVGYRATLGVASGYMVLRLIDVALFRRNENGKQGQV